VLEEGITEAGSMASFQAAATSYATLGTPMVPFYIFYSMFGFQRTGDQAWAFGDARGRGFMLGATAGRTTLNGEGLQHEDGASSASHYPPAASTTRPCLRRLIKDGLAALGRGAATIIHRALQQNHRAGTPRTVMKISCGLYRFSAAPAVAARAATILARSSCSRRWRTAPAERRCRADVYSAPSAASQRSLEVEHWNLHNPGQERRVPYHQVLASPLQRVPRGRPTGSPPGSSSRWSPHPPGAAHRWYGRATSDALRRFFDIDAPYRAVVLRSFADGACPWSRS
jgi:pyruvate dehydrogenase E1 component